MASLMDVEQSAVVLDSGCFETRVGFAGDDAPICVFPTLVGRPKYPGLVVGTDYKDCYVGDEAWGKRSLLNVKYPISRGRIESWNDMEEIYKYSCKEQLRVESSEHPIMLTWSYNEAPVSRERATQTMFEDLNVPALYICPQPILALYSTGNTSGCVLDSGHEITNIVPVFDGYSMPHTSQSMHTGGADVTSHLEKLLIEKGYCFRTSAEREMVRDIKEKLACVALNPTSTSTASEPDNARYELPDGTVIEVGKARRICTEVLFEPRLSRPEHWEAPGLPRVIYDSIMQCAVDVRKTMWGNLVLTSGNTLFPGLGARLETELAALAPSSMPIKVEAPPERKYGAWLGGSILASLSTFLSMCISKNDFDEAGTCIVHRKFM